MLWELGGEECFLRMSREQPCQQGLVAPLSVNASCVEDIQAAVRFASKHVLHLTVKNTGHDHLWRSSGDGSFAIWTHNVRGREWLDSFVPINVPKDVQGLPRDTISASFKSPKTSKIDGVTVDSWQSESGRALQDVRPSYLG